jgi:hypothetical protein
VSKPSTYNELVTAVADYTKRTDLTSTYVDYFITEAEAEMNARLRTRRQLTALTPTVSTAGVVTIPTDWAGWKRFTARDSTNAWDLDILDAEQQWDLDAAYGTAGIPKAIIAGDGNYQIWPYVDGTYTYRAFYYKAIPNLTSSASTNWLLTKHPTCYLYGVLAAARAYIMDDPRAPLWQTMFQRAMDRVGEEDALERDSRNSQALTPNTNLFGGAWRSDITSVV